MTERASLPSSPEATDYEEEAAKLAAVIYHIQTQLANWRAHQPVTAATQSAANAIHEALSELNSGFSSALDQPYFGRVDFLVANAPAGASEKIGEGLCVYIGRTAIHEHNVFSWTAPVGRLWYTNDTRYPAPKGPVDVRVDLKRFLRIRDQRLVDLSDVYRRALPGAPVRGSLGEGSKDALAEALSESGSEDGLHVIIETIEPHQYEAIANTSDRVLIVQGAAGSGKSEIGMHRIAYLLSPFNELPPRERPTADTTLFIGPSRSFLEYTADLLPLLGVEQQVSQMTFREWMSSVRSSRLSNMRFEPRVWNNLLDKGEMTLYSESAEAFKGSLGMAALLERHVSSLARQISERCKGLLAHGGMQLAGLPSPSREEVETALAEAFADVDKSYCLNQRRESFIAQTVRLIQSKRRASRRQLGFDSAETLPFEELRRRQEAERQVSAWCDQAWRRIDVRQEYASLLGDSEAMQHLSRGRLTEEETDAIAEPAAKALKDGFLDSDAGALTYLDHLLNGTIQPKYRHIVIDEAQDVSPIEFKMLSIASMNNWFTIMGDTAQRLTPYRGVRRWSEASRVFGREETEGQQARLSYRSNKQITRFNNRVRGLYESSRDAPLPYERDGHWPEYHHHALVTDMDEAVISDLPRIRSLDGLTNATIAILARDMANLNRFRKSCEEQGFNDFVLAEQGHYHAGGTLLARIPDVRGLEYDAVIVLGVNETFRNTAFNQRLLYVAITRAKHYLALHWVGRQSPILTAVSGVGVRYFDRRQGGNLRGVSAAGLRG